MMEKIKGKTADGFAFEIDDNVFHDYRFLRALRQLQQDGDAFDSIGACFDLVTVLFNDRKKEEEFYAFLAKKGGGRATVEAVARATGEIMKILQEKNKEVKN